MPDTQPVEVIRSRQLDGIAHGFLGRRGGVSAGVHAGLNVGLGSADDPASVHENRRRAAEAILPGAQLASVHQVHSAVVVTVTQAVPIDQRPHADALVTRTPGLVLGILTADCVPVLLADKTVGVVGAAHAGWKGALAGVTDATIAAMVDLGASVENITAAIGPCIARASYEVDLNFRDRFCAQDPANERFFADGRPDHCQFDIEAYVAHRLAAEGLRQIDCLGLDTYADADRFYSYRRSCHRGEPGYGRQMSLIGIAKT